jgi:hypothetical protein
LRIDGNSYQERYGEHQQDSGDGFHRSSSGGGG